jgi:hypothetical protein
MLPVSPVSLASSLVIRFVTEAATEELSAASGASS